MVVVQRKLLLCQYFLSFNDYHQPACRNGPLPPPVANHELLDIPRLAEINCYVLVECGLVICTAHQTGLLKSQIVEHLRCHGLSVEESRSLLDQMESLLAPTLIITTYEQARQIFVTGAREPRHAIFGLTCYDGWQCDAESCNKSFGKRDSFLKHNRAIHSSQPSSCTSVKVQHLFNVKHHRFYFSVTVPRMDHLPPDFSGVLSPSTTLAAFFDTYVIGQGEPLDLASPASQAAQTLYWGKLEYSSLHLSLFLFSALSSPLLCLLLSSSPFSVLYLISSPLLLLFSALFLSSLSCKHFLFLPDGTMLLKASFSGQRMSHFPLFNSLLKILLRFSACAVLV
jgi:hypothetical protein